MLMTFTKGMQFFKTYHVAIITPKLGENLRKILEALEISIRKKVYNGLFIVNTKERYDLLKTIISKEKFPFVSFNDEKKSLTTQQSELKHIREFLNTMMKDLDGAFVELHHYRTGFLKLMNDLPFIDTKAILQAFTANSKRAVVTWILDQIDFQDESGIPNVKYFLLNKPTSKPCFIWLRYDAELVYKVGERRFQVLFDEKNPTHYIPLYGKVESFNLKQGNLAARFIIVENEDTAIAMANTKDQHDFDGIFSAGGNNITGVNFINLFKAAYLSNKGLWSYFGDFDLNGFLIYQNLQKRIQGEIKGATIMQFLTLDKDVYTYLLMTFGKNIDSGKLKKYEDLEQESDSMKDVRELIKINIEFKKELEQNLLIYLDNEDGKHIID